MTGFGGCGSADAFSSGIRWKEAQKIVSLRIMGYMGSVSTSG